MRTTLILSGVLHLALMILALIGLPHLIKERDVVMLQEVPVEMVEVGPMTIAKLAEPNEKPKPPPPRPTPPKPQPPEPPQQAKEEPPPPPQVKLPEPPKPQVAEKPPEPEPPKPEPKPEPPKKEEPKPKLKPPEPKKEEKKPEPKKEEPKKSLDSILKNVAKLKPDTPPAKEAPREPSTEPPQPLNAKTGERLSISEEDALRRQIRNCWNVPVGAKGVETMQAEIRVLFDTSLRVTKVEYVSGTGNPNSDPHFRAFVESALRAPMLQGCNVLSIPREKYADKGSILMKFSPKDMF